MSHIPARCMHCNRRNVINDAEMYEVVEDRDVIQYQCLVCEQVGLVVEFDKPETTASEKK
jgi:hypothetical protein